MALYAGVWLDSCDVERYLAGALGVRVVGPRAAVVEVERGVLERAVGGGGEEGEVGKGGGGGGARLRRQRPAAGEEGEKEQEEDMTTTMQGLLDGDCEIAVHSFRGAVEGVGEGVSVQLADELADEEWDRFCDASTPWMVVDGGGGGAAEELAEAVGGGGRVAVDLDKFIKGKLAEHPYRSTI